MNDIRVWHENGIFRQEIESGKHRLVSDVSLAEGGEDDGPSPHDYLAMALGSCTAITLQMYAKRKVWSLQNAEVKVSLNKTQAGTQFIRTIKLVGDLDQDQQTRLLEIADKCPVHLTLTKNIEIKTTQVS